MVDNNQSNILSHVVGAGVKNLPSIFFLKKFKKTIDIMQDRSYNKRVIEKGLTRKEVIKMMYSEFVEGTGCKENQHNYEVFKNLEVMYMNTEMSKTEIYEYGKKLVDNSKSPEEIALETEIKNEIEHWKNEIARFNREIEWAKGILEICKEEGNDELAWFRKNDIKFYTEQKREARSKITALKWVLG